MAIFHLRRGISTKNIPTSSNASQYEAESLIKQFIIRNTSEEKEAGSLDPAIVSLNQNWGNSSTSNLPLYSPLKQSPYEFHSTKNGDPSYLSIPRLAVTKLLVNRWCELREYYGVYSGSLGLKHTKAIEMGNQRHQQLEDSTHAKLDVSALQQTIDSIYDEIVRREEMVNTEERGDSVNPELLSMHKLSMPIEEFNETVYGSSGVSELASQWSNQIITRLYALITTSEAREVLVHAYADLTTGSFLETSQEVIENQTDPGVINAKKVLISGIIDYLKLANQDDPTNLSLFEEIRWNEEFYCDHIINQNMTLDLTKFMDRTKGILKDHFPAYRVRVTDVKTRSYNKLPPQQSVLDGAKLQTMYYRRMLGILASEGSSDDLFSYHSLLENARQRGLNIDEPINMSVILVLLRQHFHLFYKDFVKLALGEPIGHEAYDKFMEENTFDSYDLDQLVRMDVEVEEEETKDTHAMQQHSESYKPFEKLSLAENFNYNELFTSELVKAWKYPPTLRYFAARSSQFYSLLRNLISDSTTVEYHNVKTDRCFHTSEYSYDTKELSLHLSSSSAFWSGTRQPDFTTDLDKCKYCEFKNKCVIPSGTADTMGGRESIGIEVNNFLSHVSES